MPMFADAHFSSLGYLWFTIKQVVGYSYIIMMNILTNEFEFEVANLYFYQKILYAITSFIYFILLVFNNTA